MNNLGLYIKEALEERQEISVPGIGVFTKKRTPAYFDALQDKFMPPFSHITLHEQETADDSFVSFVSEREGVTVDATRSKLEKALDVLRFDLDRQRDVILEGLGTLSKKEEKLVFAPGVADNEVKAFEPVTEGSIVGPVPVEEVIMVDPAEASTLADEPEPEAEPQLVSESPTTRRRLWPAIAVAICVVLAGFWFLWPSLQQPVSNPVADEKPAIVPVTAIPDSTKGDSLENIVDSPLSEDSTALVAQENVAVSVEEGPQESYEIIIAAFNTMKEAQEYVAKTNAKGHQVYILKNNRPSNLNKISYSSFKTEKEATLALTTVRKELNPEAWIYKRIKNNHQ